MVSKAKPVKTETVLKRGEHLVWQPIDNYAAAFALALVLGGFFLAVKGTTEVNDTLIQIAGGLFILTGFTVTRLLKLVSKR